MEQENISELSVQILVHIHGDGKTDIEGSLKRSHHKNHKFFLSESVSIVKDSLIVKVKRKDSSQLNHNPKGQKVVIIIILDVIVILF